MAACPVGGGGIVRWTYSTDYVTLTEGDADTIREFWFWDEMDVRIRFRCPHIAASGVGRLVFKNWESI